MKQKLVVIGNGMAGIRTLEELLKSAPDQYDITVFGAEPYGNYNRIMLSAVLSGDKNIEDIIINDRQWYADNRITLHAGRDKSVIRIDRKIKRVFAQDGTTADYDRLLIATGSKPIIPDIPGNDLQGVIGFREILDVNTMLSYCRNHQKAVVIGGGLLGLEAAYGLKQRGMQVTVVHSNRHLLNRQMDNLAGKILQEELEQKGLNFKMSAKSEALLGIDGHVRKVCFSDGTELDCDLVVLAIGVQPNIKLAQQAGLHCDKGIIVNDTLQTYDPSIYAVGECIQHRGVTFGLVAPLFEQAKVCANHLSAHGVAEYITLPSAIKLKVTGINLFSLGNFLGDDYSSSIYFTDRAQGVYKKLVIKNSNIIGVVLYGDTSDGFWYQTLLEQHQDITSIRSELIFGQAFVESLEQYSGNE